MNRFASLFGNFARSARNFGRNLASLGKKDLFININEIPQSVFGTYRRGYDYTKATYANVIAAPVFWAMRAFTESRAIVQRRESSNVWKEVEDHDLAALIDSPNPFYDGDALWKGSLLSFMLAGNAYWQKVRNVFGEVVQLWWIPHWMIQPTWALGTGKFIDYYQYSPNGVNGAASTSPVILEPRDVVHFRFGLDPMNPRLGVAPLAALIQEVFTDLEAAEFTESILGNMGIPGLMVSPADASSRVTPKQVEELKAEIQAAFTGKNRGSSFVLGVPTKVEQFGFDPNKLMLANIRDIAEERVCAVLGVPAAVVGFGSGLQSTKVGATMRELTRLARVQCINPMQNTFARQLNHQLLPDFVAQTKRFRTRFDNSDVSTFQEEQNMTVDRVTKSVLAGMLRVDRAQEMTGLEVDPTQRVYLRPTNTVPVGPDAPVDPSRAFPAGGDPSEQPGAASGDPTASDGSSGDNGDGGDPADDAQKMLAAIARRLPRTNGAHR